MSLIEQALRRAQDPVLNTTTTSAPQQTAASEPKAHSWNTEALPPSPATPGAAPRVTNALVAVALAVIGLTAVLVIGGAFWMGQTVNSPQPARQPATAEQPAVNAPADAPEKIASVAATRAPARRATRTEAAFVLSGVVEGVGNPYAVINGEIASIGDQVGSATLVAISGSTATLRLANDEPLVLRVAQ